MDSGKIAAEDYKFLAELLFRATGMELGPNKEYLLESRLKEVWEKLDLKGISELIRHMKTTNDLKVAKIIGEKMTTNETLFFRDQAPFDFFRQVVLPEAFQRNLGREIKIWSAACSTGQEPYSIAICLQEEAKKYPFQKIEILATDISVQVLDRAKAGVFSKYEMSRGMPQPLQEKYFQPKGADFEVKPELKKYVQFQECNLLNFQSNQVFDCIFLRNVLIYFDLETKAKIIEGMRNQLNPKGYIYLGAAETMMGIHDKFVRVENSTCSVYRKI